MLLNPSYDTYATPSASTLPATTFHPDYMPDRYALICKGDCMAPRYVDGQGLYFSKSEPWKPGDCVVLFRRPELVGPGECQMLFKQLVLAPPTSYWRQRAGDRQRFQNLRQMIIIKTLNPDRHIQFYADDFLGIHKLTGAEEL